MPNFAELTFSSNWAIKENVGTQEMEKWIKIALILCAYGVIKEFRPSEQFITNYFIKPPMNFTEEQVSTKIYPVGIYSTMIILIFVLLLTDLVRYKPIIILCSISGITYSVMLITSRSLFLVQLVEVFYGLFTACEVAYYTYIYAKVDKKHFQAVSSYTRAAYLTGRSISGISSQILVLTGFSYYSLNFFSLGGMIISLVWAFMLPSVPSSIYFNAPSVEDLEENSSRQENETCMLKMKVREKGQLTKKTSLNVKRGFYLLWCDFKTAATNCYVVKWSLWWSLGTCVYYQVLSYIQLLWAEISNGNDTEYHNKLNGAVETGYTLLSALGAFLIGKLTIDWSIYGECILFVCSLATALVLMLMSQTSSMWVAYIGYIIYTIIYNCMITIANSEVAKHVNPDSYGLIFGMLYFITLVLQSLITLIAVNVLNLTATKLFGVCSYYFCFLTIVFVIKLGHQLYTRYFRIRRSYSV